MSPETMGTVGTWGPILIMVLIFYFLLYRPQKNEQKRRRNMLDNLKKGNRVMTIGGIYGQVTEIKDKIVKIKIAEHVEIELARSSINANVSQENAEKKA